jgi:hypothetical protein
MGGARSTRRGDEKFITLFEKLERKRLLVNGWEDNIKMDFK